MADLSFLVNKAYFGFNKLASIFLASYSLSNENYPGLVMMAAVYAVNDVCTLALRQYQSYYEGLKDGLVLK